MSLRPRRSALVAATRAVVATIVLGALAAVLPAGAASAVELDDVDPPGVVVVGTGGLHWTDIDRATTPTLWRMTATGSVGSISVRTASPETCPVDAWLTLSAGRRLTPPDAEPDAGTDAGTDGGADGGSANGDGGDGTGASDDQAGAPSPHTVAGWAELLPDPTDPTEAGAGVPGTLGERLSAVGACTTAVGPGAALALATADGRVARYASDLDEIDVEELTACPVAVVDLGELGAEPGLRQAALGDLDDALARLVDEVPVGWRVVVAGVSDAQAEQPGLQVVVDWVSGGSTAGWLTSESTRRAGIVTLADLSATVADVVDVDATDLDGAPLEVDSDRRMSVERTVENRRYLTEMTTTVAHLMPVLAGVLALGALAAAAALLALHAAARRAPGRAVAAGTRRLVVAALLLVATGPAGAYLAALSRWWVSPAPLVAASLWCAVAVVAVALLAWPASRRLPAGPWSLAAAAAGLTWLVLTLDGLTGTVLQQGSILGATPTVGARYYGFGNVAFSVYAVSGLVLAGALAAAALAAGRRRAAVVATLAVGLVTVAVDGWPGLGADVGGILALVPAFVVLVLGVAGEVVTVRRALAAGGLAVAVTLVVGLVDLWGPGPGSHLGLFLQRLVDGQAWSVVAGKAAGAWATVAHPAGALAAVVCLAAALVLVGPDRWRPAGLRRAQAAEPVLRPLVVAVVVAAGLGSALNDSGIAVGVVVLGLAAVVLGGSWLAHAWFAVAPVAGPDGARRPDGAAKPGGAARGVPPTLLAVGGGLLAALLLGAAVVPLPAVAAGDVVRTSAGRLVAEGTPVVVVGTAGVRWDDISRSTTPTLWGLVRDGAATGGIAPGVTGRDGRCAAAGWLALSAGRAPVAGQDVDGTWVCAPWGLLASAGGSATVAGWPALTTLQQDSEFDPRLGVLGETLAQGGVCSTAVGRGAALALAGPDGAVERYRSVEQALADPDEAFACPVTVVDAGAVPYRPEPASAAAAAPSTTGTASTTGTTPSPTPTPSPTSTLDPAAPEPSDDGAERSAALADLDATVRLLLAAAPSGATVLVVDVGNPSPARPSLGFGAVEADGDLAGRFLSTPSTRWEGAARLLDVPSTVLAAAGLPDPTELSGSPLTAAGVRPTDVPSVVDQLADLTTRDHALRGVAGSVTTTPLLVVLALLLAVWAVGGRVAARVGERRAATAGRVVDAVLLVAASMPAGMFLMTTWSWWRADAPGPAMWGALAASTAAVAGLGALAPWRPSWAGPAVVAAVTFGVLTLDAVLGTPLHRGSPLGPAPTLGGRYYGFGNPTYSIYVVAALVTAVAVGTWLLRTGRRVVAAGAAAGIGALALVVDLWPTLGADVGGGLVLVPAFAIVVLAVAGVRVTWQRLGLIGAAGVLLVGAIGVLDWSRPTGERSHLGRFVQGVVDGTAWETVARKAGYAAQSVTSGPTAWLTVALVVAFAVLLWPGSRVRVGWFDRAERDWPLLRPLLVSLGVAAVAGSVVNDYGTRIATVLLAAAVPVLGMVVLRGRAGPGTGQPLGSATTEHGRGRGEGA